MPEHLRALVVVLGISIPAFWLARRALCNGLMSREDYDRRRKLWFAVTLLAFLSHHFWLYIVLCGALLLLAGSKERNPAALYALLIVAVPGFEQPIPGMGLIEHVFVINHARLLALVVLLPAVLRMSRATQGHLNGPWIWCDRLLLAYLVFSFIHRATFDSLTGTLRFGFYLWLDIWLPYFALTRTLRSEKALKEAMAALVLAVSVTAVIAVFETTRHWLIYESLRSALQLPQVLPMYLTRGDWGGLRANVTSLNAIALGYTMMIGLIFAFAIGPRLTSRAYVYLLIAVLAAGLLAALSRGPWVGAAAGMFATMAFGPGGVKRGLKLLVWSSLGFGLVLLTPHGARFIDLLPFVGTVESGNVEYRARLFEVSMIVFRESPIFGLPDYLSHPAMEEMRQGQGIIDIVNTYIGVALYSGAVGLLLFIAPFLSVGLLVWRALSNPLLRIHGREDLGRSLLGALVAAALTIATVSSITVIPVFYWMLLAFCVAFVAQVHAASVAARQSISSSGTTAYPEASGMGPRHVFSSKTL